MIRPLSTLAALAIGLAACTAPGASTAPPATSATPTTIPTQPPITSPPATVVPATPTAAATADCIISVPTQILTDLTPVVVRYDGLTAEQCAGYLKVAPDASQWTKDHPPTQLSSPPSQAPSCVVMLAGVTTTVWGTTGAEFLCKSLQAAASMAP